MKRKLIQQMRNEWRSNLWMMIELFIVGLVLWIIFVMLNSLFALHQEPVGADYSDLFTGEFGYIPESSSNYVPYDEGHSFDTDREMILAKLRSNPYVEIVGTGSNALPYNYNYNGGALTAEIDGKEQSYYANVRRMSPEAILAIRLEGINGETPEQLATMVRRGDVLIGTTELSYGDVEIDVNKWKGVEARPSDDTLKTITVAAVVNGIRRSDYEPTSGTIICDDPWHSNVIIRVKEGQGRKFMESVTGEDLEHGNLYVSHLQSVDDLREGAHADISVLYRNMTVCAVFVLVSVFLGFLGSFWYRTQQRVPELALRKVNGATDSDLFRRFIGEGLLLLVVPAVLMVPSGMAVIALLNGLSDSESGSSLIFDFHGLPIGQWVIWAGLAMAVAALVVMIVAGIWLPARKAMKVEPALALKDQ